MLKLVTPDISHQSQWEEIMKEWKNNESPLNPGPLFLGDNYNEFLYCIGNNHTGKTPNRVPGTLFFLINENHRVLGAVEIRHHIEHPDVKEVGGHIGYGIRPSERRKGFAKEMLKLALIEARKFGIYDVLITCSDDNIGSYKTIEVNGGIFERFTEKDGVKKRRYWIDLYPKEKELLKSLELELHTSECRKNPDRIDELLADDFFECGKTGKMFGKKECLEWLPAEKDKKITAKDISVHMLSPEIGQVRYLSQSGGDGEEFTTSFRSSLWRKGESGWKMFYHQGTLINTLGKKSSSSE